MIQDTNNEAMNIGAAVAEGVDTAELRRLLGRVQGWSDEQPVMMEGSVQGNASRELIAYITTYGAQQREAGRREERVKHQQTVDSLVRDYKAMERSKDEIQANYNAACERAVKAEAALARQPVSEGLTDAEALPVGICFSESMCNFYRADSGAVMDDSFYDKWRDRADEFPDRATARAALSAVPTAKAEGMSDEQRWQEVVRRIGYRETGTAEGPVWTIDLPTPRRSGNTDENFVAEIDRAILAQQAKKGGAV